MVEASVVLPILILVILSMIMLIIFYFSCLKTQVELHNKLDSGKTADYMVFNIKREQTYVSGEIGGFAGRIMKKKVVGRCYSFNFANSLRLGEMLEFEQEE